MIHPNRSGNAMSAVRQALFACQFFPAGVLASKLNSFMGSIFFGIVIGLVAWFLVRYLAAGFYTVNQNERAVKTSFGRAERVGDATTSQDPIAASLNEEEKERAD